MQCTPCTDRGAGADALGQCLEKQLEGVCVPRVQHGRDMGDLQVPQIMHLLQVSHLTSSPASTLRGSPKHILFTQMEGWRGGQERFGGY